MHLVESPLCEFGGESVGGKSGHHKKESVFYGFQQIHFSCKGEERIFLTLALNVARSTGFTKHASNQKSVKTGLKSPAVFRFVFGLLAYSLLVLRAGFSANVGNIFFRLYRTIA